jgi:ribosomal protein S18 acetylase RimI-like enzyme
MVAMTDAAAALRVERLQPAAAGELLTLRLAALAVTQPRAGNGARPTPPTPAPSQTFDEVARQLEDRDVIVLGAWAGGRLVGTVAARIDGRRAALSDFAVAPDFQSQGVGTRVLLTLPEMLPDGATVFVASEGEAREVTLASLRRIVDWASK